MNRHDRITAALAILVVVGSIITALLFGSMPY